MPRARSHPHSGAAARDEGVRRTAAEQAEHIAALRERIEFLTDQEQNLQNELRQAHAELARRDEEQRASADAAIRKRDERLASLDDQLRAANRTIQMMQSTRAWRLGHMYWRARSFARQLVSHR